MRKILFLFLFVIFAMASEYAYGQDNLLAVDVVSEKPAALTQADKPNTKEEALNNTAQDMQEEVKLDDDSAKDLEKIKAYHDLIDNRQKELELIKLDLEKSSLLLKKKEAEKEIFEIDKFLPQGKKGITESAALTQEVKEPLVDASEIKIQLLLITDNSKEGQLSLKGAPYGFKEGDSIASRLTVEKIEPSSVTLKQSDNSLLKINFIN